MIASIEQLRQVDCIDGMNSLPGGCVDLVFADPPFNIGYEYDVYVDSLDYTAYLEWSRRWLTAVHRVLKSNGTFWLAIGDEHAAELKLESQKLGFRCRSWVIWYYTFGVNCSNKFTRSHAHLLYFVKNPRSSLSIVRSPKTGSNRLVSWSIETEEQIQRADSLMTLGLSVLHGRRERWSMTTPNGLFARFPRRLIPIKPTCCGRRT